MHITYQTFGKYHTFSHANGFPTDLLDAVIIWQTRLNISLHFIYLFYLMNSRPFCFLCIRCRMIGSLEYVPNRRGLLQSIHPVTDSFVSSGSLLESWCHVDSVSFDVTSRSRSFVVDLDAYFEWLSSLFLKLYVIYVSFFKLIW